MLPVDSVYGPWPESGEIDVSRLSPTIAPLLGVACDATYSYFLLLLIIHFPLHITRLWRPGATALSTKARV